MLYHFYNFGMTILYLFSINTGKYLFSDSVNYMKSFPSFSSYTGTMHLLHNTSNFGISETLKQRVAFASQENKVFPARAGRALDRGERSAWPISPEPVGSLAHRVWPRARDPLRCGGVVRSAEAAGGGAVG